MKDVLWGNRGYKCTRKLLINAFFNWCQTCTSFKKTYMRCIDICIIFEEIHVHRLTKNSRQSLWRLNALNWLWVQYSICFFTDSFENGPVLPLHLRFYVSICKIRPKTTYIASADNRQTVTPLTVYGFLRPSSTANIFLTRFRLHSFTLDSP